MTVSTSHLSDLERQRVTRSPAVLGYADRRSVRAGERITFYVSSAGGADYSAELVQLFAPDIGPIGPAFRTRPVDVPCNGTHRGVEQPIYIGSCMRVAGPLPLGTSLHFEVTAFPTLIDPHPATIVAISGTEASLTITSDREALRAIITDRDRNVVGAVSVGPLAEREWASITVDADTAAGSLSLATSPLPTPGAPARSATAASATWESAPVSFGGASLMLAATPAGTHHDPRTCFNGKLEAPSLSTGDQPAAQVASWDFARRITTEIAPDTGPGGHHGTLVNYPTRGTRGSMWSGTSLSWVASPEEYAAIHFHESDLADAGWEPSFEVELSPSLPSGCYGLRLEPVDKSTPEFWVPFVVRPAAGAATNDVAYVLPTTTYGAYANMHLRVTAQFNELAHARLTVLDSTDFLLLNRPDLGMSTYDVHRDGSPVIYSSMNRPVTNFRPTGRMYKFCLDLMITDWLDAMGIEADFITDDDLHVEGDDALAPYRVAITGSHPEYLTRRQYDTFERFTRRGGRLMYLGGNGFYSAAEVPEHRLDITEVRRPGQDNLWRVNHAEGAFSSSGRPGGLWRNIGLPENAVIGVGFITQGFDACTFYERSEASREPRTAWIFEGLDDDAVIGDFGVLQGGAAGYEIDRHEVSKGSPRHSVVVASSRDHSNVYDLMVPSILDTLPDPRRTQDPIRADMTFFETDSGGAVFSVGSIAWAGSLSHNDYVNSVSAVTANVVRRFSDPRPFELPAGA